MGWDEKLKPRLPLLLVNNIKNATKEIGSELRLGFSVIAT